VLGARQADELKDVSQRGVALGEPSNADAISFGFDSEKTRRPRDPAGSPRVERFSSEPNLGVPSAVVDISRTGQLSAAVDHLFPATAVPLSIDSLETVRS
jgi:hypothetical protein